MHNIVSWKALNLIDIKKIITVTWITRHTFNLKHADLKYFKKFIKLKIWSISQKKTSIFLIKEMRFFGVLYPNLSLKAKLIVVQP